MENKSLSYRVWLAIIGTIILSVSINFIIGINWGMATFDTACLTTQYLFNIEQFGDAVLLTHVLFIILLLLFMKKFETTWKQMGIAVISILIVSRVINMFGFLIDIEYTNNFIKLIVFLINVGTVNLAIYLMATSQLVATPYDRFVIQFAASTDRDLGRARLIVDVLTFIVAFGLIVIFKLPVPITFATLFIVLASGPIITFWGKVFKY